MAGSRVVAVRKAVVAALQTALAADIANGLMVSYGYQGGDDDRRREQIFTNNARATHEPAGLKAGRNFRDETMEFDIVLQVVGVNKKPEENDERAMALGLLIEETLADRKSNELAVSGLQWLIVSGFELTNRYGPSGSHTEITYTVRYHARLT